MKNYIMLENITNSNLMNGKTEHKECFVNCAFLDRYI